MSDKVSGDWIDILVSSVGKYISIETGDGVIREGKMSGFRCRTIKIDGFDVQVPIEIELNGDMNDTVSLGRIYSIDFN